MISFGTFVYSDDYYDYRYIISCILISPPPTPLPANCYGLDILFSVVRPFFRPSATVAPSGVSNKHFLLAISC